MTTYTAIANSEVDPDSPVTTSLVTNLRDNPLAIIENDASAPIIVGLNPIAKFTASSAAQLSITGLDSTYDMYKIEIVECIPTSSSVDLRMQVSTDGGSTWVATNTYRSIPVGSSVATTATYFTLTTTNTQAGSTAAVGNIMFYNYTASKKLLSSYDYNYSGGSSAFDYAALNNDNVSSMNAFKLYFSSGNITATAYVYGIVNRVL